MKRITREMLVCDILDINPQLEEIFIAHGMNCMGCPGSNAETLADAAEGHDVDLKKLLEVLNKANEFQA